MNQAELEKYLEVRSILDLKGYELDNKGQLDCPLHEGCTGSWQLYEELNGVACMRSSCRYYQYLFRSIELLQELESCNKKQAVLIGKSMLLKELEDYRSKSKVALESSLSKNTNYEMTRGSEELLSLLQQEFSSVSFGFDELRKRVSLEVGKSTLTKYLKTLRDSGYLEIVSGNRYRGYEYKLV